MRPSVISPRSTALKSPHIAICQAKSATSDHSKTLLDVPRKLRSVNQRKTRHNVQFKNVSELLFLKNIFIDFLQRGRERDRELETSMREKHRSAASCTPPTRDVPTTNTHRTRTMPLPSICHPAIPALFSLPGVVPCLARTTSQRLPLPSAWLLTGTFTLFCILTIKPDKGSELLTEQTLL
ncbi:hypothetical protein QTO34_007814 [Cnephaeus nilssonii]|uniref:Uncharacterized protein n=1 Tax=Cnephaeus nilssonii TaxID=3371016 RepID=A0AA40LHT2_CNENI|nr:hypothetical protein QTO34_007814 [Eptesicus nilssonii]